MLKHMCVVAGLLMLFGGVAQAQEGCKGAAPGGDPIQEFQRLLECTKQSIVEARTRLGNLSDIKMDEFANGLRSERDQLNGLLKTRTAALEKANADIAALVIERDQLAELVRTRTTALEKAQAENRALTDSLVKANAEITGLTSERDRLIGEVKGLTAALEKIKAQNEALRLALEKNAVEINALRAELEKNNTTIAKLTAELEKTNAEIAALTGKLETTNAEIAALTAKLDKTNADIATLTAELEKTNARIADLTTALNKANAQIAALERERDQLRAALNDANVKIAALMKEIADLKCNVDRLAAQRSAFFASLSGSLGNNSGVTIVGDRFVIPSGVFFPVGSADLSKEGSTQILRIAEVVRQLESKIPESVSWVLQVDGHTDIQKILPGGKFKSNWQLSTARALTVVELLDDLVTPEHLAAAGFGEYQPIDPARTQEAYAKNRRIELKLTDDGPGNPNSAPGAACPALVSMN